MNSPNAPAVAATGAAIGEVRLDRRDVVGRPEVAEVGRDGRAVAADQDAEDDQGEQRQRLGRGEGVLDQLAQTDAAGVEPGQEDDQQDADELLHRQADGVLPGEVDRRDDPGGRGDRREQHPQKPGEAHGHGGDGSRLDHQEQRPAVEEPPERRVGLAQVDVLAARLRHHRRQLAVGESGGDRQQPGHHPDRQQPAGGPHLPRDLGRDDEDPRADHRAGHDHGRIEKPELADEARFFFLAAAWSRGDAFLHRFSPKIRFILQGDAADVTRE